MPSELSSRTLHFQVAFSNTVGFLTLSQVSMPNLEDFSGFPPPGSCQDFLLTSTVVFVSISKKIVLELSF